MAHGAQAFTLVVEMPLGYSADLQHSDPILHLQVHCGNLVMTSKENAAVFHDSRHWRP